MLACALGAGYLSILENIDSLSAEYGVVVGGSQCIGKVCLVSNPVAAVFRLSVDGVAGNAEYLLLLHKREIMRLQARVQQDGYALVPLSLYLSGPRVKVELALARGKKLYDKREAAAQRDAKREMDRFARGRY